MESRVKNAQLMDSLVEGLPGVEKPKITPGGTHVYWKYCLRIDPKVIEGGVDRFAKELKARGIWSAPRYIQKPAFMCQVIADRVTFGKSGFPSVGPHREGLPPVEYRVEDYPGTTEALSRVCVLPWNEFYTEDDVRWIATAVQDVAEQLRVGRRRVGASWKVSVSVWWAVDASVSPTCRRSRRLPAWSWWR